MTKEWFFKDASTHDSLAIKAKHSHARTGAQVGSKAPQRSNVTKPEEKSKQARKGTTTN